MPGRKSQIHASRSTAQKLLNGRELVFGLAQGAACRFEPRVFERFVGLAAECGATHIAFAGFPFRYGSWFLPDNRDPYPAWSNATFGLFRVFPPKALRPWISTASARALQRILTAQMRIVRRYGLKAVVDGCEPLWLPEAVYRAHPDWRGPQCELGRIADKPYFAPSIDEPEVLDLYREAMRAMAQRFPEIDQLSFLANDSGAGVSWSPCLYPGMNGPTRWRTRDPGERLAKWLQVMQEGAAAGGAQVRLNVWSSGLPAATVMAARTRLGQGLFVNGGNGRGEQWGGPGANLGNGLWSFSYPAVGLGSPVDFMAGLQAVYANRGGDALRAHIGLEPANLELARTLLESWLAAPGPGLIARDRALLRAAEGIAGSARHAEELVGVWHEIKLADLVISKVQQKGFCHLLPFGCVSMRWLIRPLVPQPERLAAAETDYFTRFMFSKDPAAEKSHLGFFLGKPVFVGSCAVWLARWALVDVISRLGSARQRVLAMLPAAPRAAAQRLQLYADRIGAYACLAETARNCIMYQYALDTADQPQFGPNMMDYDDNIVYDQRALGLRKIAREEVDNTVELLQILAAQKGPVLNYARRPAEESVFMLGPNLQADLRRKLDIMLNHWQDYERLYPATKVWDFEPPLRGNIALPGAGAAADTQR
jgi:hypothetical protein